MHKAYLDGFSEKCAHYGVAPEHVVKLASVFASGDNIKASILGSLIGGAGGYIGSNGKSKKEKLKTALITALAGGATGNLLSHVSEINSSVDPEKSFWPLEKAITDAAKLTYKGTMRAAGKPAVVFD